MGGTTSPPPGKGGKGENHPIIEAIKRELGAEKVE
jgi:hypothetical protein